MNNKVFTILFLVGFILIPSVLAANSQGLAWGVEEGQEFRFTLHMAMNVQNSYMTTTMDETENLLFTVDYLPTIPTVIESQYDLPWGGGTMTYANGSAIGMLPMGISMYTMILPV